MALQACGMHKQSQLCTSQQRNCQTAHQRNNGLLQLKTNLPIRSSIALLPLGSRLIVKYTLRTSLLLELSAFQALLAGDPRMRLLSKLLLLLLLLLLRCPLPDSCQMPRCRTAPRCTSTPQTAVHQPTILRNKTSKAISKLSLEFMCIGQGEGSVFPSRLEATEQPTNRPVNTLPNASGASRVGKLLPASVVTSRSGNNMGGAVEMEMIQLLPIARALRFIVACRCC